MPSWPPRLHTPGSGAKSKARTSKSPSYHENQLNDHTYDDLPHLDVPVIALTGSSSPSRPSHGRSYSQPFPSILSNGKRAEKNHGSHFKDNVLKTSTESQLITTELTIKDSMAANETPLQNGEKELVTGKCITCDSRVRWPRHLSVFRCTVCLMINDLNPRAGLMAEGHWDEEGPCTTTPSSNPGPSRKGTRKPVITKFLSNVQKQFRICLSTKLKP